MIVVKGPELRRLLGNLSDWTAHDETRPILQGIHVIAAAGRLHGVAADPYSLAFDSIEADIVDDDIEVTIPQATIRLILRELTVQGWNNKELITISHEEQGWTVSFALAKLEHIFLPPVGNFPDWRQVVPASGTKAIARIALNSYFMSRIAEVKADLPWSRYYFHGPQGPVVVEVGQTFKAVIMPLRITDQDNGLPQVALPPLRAAKEALEPA